VHGESACQRVLCGGGLRDCKTISVKAHQLSTHYQLLQAVRELTAFLTVNAQFTNQLLEAGSVFHLALNVPKNGGVGR
jgi:hypothetical protein